MRKIILFFIPLIIFNSCSIQHKLNKINWIENKNQDFIFFYKDSSLTKKNITKVYLNLKTSIEKTQQKTQIQNFRKPIKFYIVDSPKEIFDLTKDKASGLSFFKRNLIIETHTFSNQSHEIFHLISQQNWGTSKLWIVEGSAVYIDGFWYGKNIHKLAKEFLNKNEIISFDLVNKNKIFKKNDQRLMYVQSGSFCKYLIDTFGIEKFIQFWKNKNAKKVYFKSLTELESSWKLFLKNTSF